jgi:hypothetical protein
MQIQIYYLHTSQRHQRQHSAQRRVFEQKNFLLLESNENGELEKKLNI